MKLWVDDIRNSPDDSWIIARDYNKAIDCLDTGFFDVVSLDHDLGDESAKTGYNIVCWIEKKIVTGEWTTLPTIYVHSANPVGRRNIERAISSCAALLEMRNRVGQ